MSGILGNAVPGAGGSAYTIDNSLRFRKSATAYLSKTFSSAGNQQKMTFSTWVKRGNLGSSASAINTSGYSGGGGTQGGGFIYFGGGDAFSILQQTNNSADYELVTTQVFRDPSSWYHIVVAIDTTQATASNRIKLYVNGTQVTTFSTSNYPSQNLNTKFNATNQRIGAIDDAGNPYITLDGYLSEYYFIDGQALTPSSFGETNASTGVWQPKAYTGTYGTNGFYLKFSDIATTSGSNAGLGKDFSGNGNYWTTNNISVTSGVTYDAMTDSPTPASATVGNFCTLNPNLRQTGTSSAPTNGNLKITVNNTSGYGNGVGATMAASSGKWYWEITKGGTYGKTGIANTNGTEFTSVMCSTSSTPSDFDAYSWGWALNVNTGNKINAGSSTAYGGSLASGDIIMCAVDVDAGKVWWGKNGTWFASGDPAAGTNAAFTNVTGNIMPIGVTSDTGSNTQEFNFGQRPFSYTPPTGFKRLNTYNLATPTIGASSTTLANKYFDINLYTGNATARSIVNSGSMQPDFVWIKHRSTAENHNLYDSLRGPGYRLESNSTAVQFYYSDRLTAFNSNGFSLGTGYNNTNGTTYVAWQWKGNGSGSSNTAGSITSTVSANTTAGFSVVTYTGTGANATVGHGIGIAPQMVIVKNIQTAGTSWKTYHVGLTSAAYALEMETTGAEASTPACWNSTAPTSTVVSLGSNAGVNQSGITHVMYCFAPVAGFSKFGKYTGNGSSDGPFVYTGFRPKYVMVKRIDSIGGNWPIQDGVRNPYNASISRLWADLSNAETDVSNYAFDLVSNGFKLRNTNTDSNGSGGTYIYMAFAESPFNYSLAR